ncbi:MULTISPECIES: hypothetical protein [unclassified Cupriavidus]|uniref:hypothetical protein n=1 Tax=Cupriavidus sp. H19C3 TaxID=3241603 RepID=UPI003BF8E88F
MKGRWRRATRSAFGLTLLLGMAAGCAGGPGASNGQSGVTAYGTVDSGISVTRER